MKYIHKPEKSEIVTSWYGTKSSGGTACSKEH